MKRNKSKWKLFKTMQFHSIFQLPSLVSHSSVDAGRICRSAALTTPTTKASDKSISQSIYRKSDYLLTISFGKNDEMCLYIFTENQNKTKKTQKIANTFNFFFHYLTRFDFIEIFLFLLSFFAVLFFFFFTTFFRFAVFSMFHILFLLFMRLTWSRINEWVKWVNVFYWFWNGNLRINLD